MPKVSAVYFFSRSLSDDLILLIHDIKNLVLHPLRKRLVRWNGKRELEQGRTQRRDRGSTQRRDDATREEGGEQRRAQRARREDRGFEVFGSRIRVEAQAWAGLEGLGRKRAECWHCFAASPYVRLEVDLWYPGNTPSPSHHSRPGLEILKSPVFPSRRCVVVSSPFAPFTPFAVFPRIFIKCRGIGIQDSSNAWNASSDSIVAVRRNQSLKVVRSETPSIRSRIACGVTPNRASSKSRIDSFKAMI